ncbi:hypothetical protein [Caballeronia glebae]|uniref:hypothetical protein n=1 Tax=Caballeronia glebae TaxID=1777143 RepID=UPI0038B91A50
MTTQFFDILERARKNPGGDHVFYNQNGDVRGVVKQSSAVRGVIDLNGDTLPDIQDKDGNFRRPPAGTPAVQNSRVDAAIIKQSLVASAGANVIIYQDATEAVSDTAGGIVMVRRPRYFETIEAAPFALVPDGQEVGVTPLPIKRADIHIDTDSGLATNTGIYGLRFEFTRAVLKSFPSVDEAIMHAITAGLARTADAVLLGAIVAATPAAFSLAAAAAAGVRMSELRSLIGTAAHGATIDQNGVLRAAGIAAELTPDMAATIVGTFARSAIMIRSDVDVIAERTNINGELSVTAWAALQPLLPDTSRFWTVAA